jgi:protein involved in ribonucleotide reduction
MLVFFSSTSENTARFIKKLDVPALRLPLKTADAGLVRIDEDFILVTPTYGAGSKGFVPKQVISFLNQEENRVRCKGVIGSGNRNFHEDFCKAADIVSAKLQVPVLYRFELAGTDEDVNITQQGLNKFWHEYPQRVPST